MLLKSTSNFYVNNAIEVLKEEKLKGKERRMPGNNKENILSRGYLNITLPSS